MVTHCFFLAGALAVLAVSFDVYGKGFRLFHLGIGKCFSVPGLIG